jgi:cyanophycinase
MGYILLEGGAEFGGHMAEPDLRAIELAGGFDALICIIPAAAAPDHNDRRAGENGLQWFRHLGATNIQVLPLVSNATAHQADIVEALLRARLIYMLGGFPGHLAESLRGTPAWQAAVKAMNDGAVFGGSSAGAMVLCEYLYDPYQNRLLPGLGLLADSAILPHHNNFGKDWALPLHQLIPTSTLIGIDERTGMINDGEKGQWRVYGQGAVTLYRDGNTRVFSSGQTFNLDSGSQDRTNPT